MAKTGCACLAGKRSRCSFLSCDAHNISYQAARMGGMLKATMPT